MLLKLLIKKLYHIWTNINLTYNLIKNKMFWKIKREILHIYHRIKYWVSEKDTWWLTDTINWFIYEGLKKFKKLNNWHPACYSEKQWEDILYEMIEWYELIVQYKEMPFKWQPDIENYFYTWEEARKIKRAKKLYNSHNLWR